MSDNIRGWETMYELYKAYVKKKLDLVLLLVHFSLTKHGFRCITLKSADEKVDPATHRGSEILPPGWNASDDKNVLNYIYENRHYHLLWSSSAENTVFNLVEQIDDPRVTSVMFNVETTVSSLDAPVESLITDLEQILLTIAKELVRPFAVKRSRDTGSQTEKDKFPKKAFAPSSAFGMPAGSQSPESTRPAPLGIGASDLYPLGRNPVPGMAFPSVSGPGGGGMIFDPFHRDRDMPGMGGRVPPGFIPGSRYDPIGPMGPNPVRPFAPNPMGPFAPGRPAPHPGTPDPDHMPPPGYEDMFM